MQRDKIFNGKRWTENTIFDRFGIIHGDTKSQNQYL